MHLGTLIIEILKLLVGLIKHGILTRIASQIMDPTKADHLQSSYSPERIMATNPLLASQKWYYSLIEQLRFWPKLLPLLRSDLLPLSGMPSSADSCLLFSSLLEFQASDKSAGSPPSVEAIR